MGNESKKVCVDTCLEWVIIPPGFKRCTSEVGPGRLVVMPEPSVLTALYDGVTRRRPLGC